MGLSDRPLVSVVIPTQNSGDTIKTCLNSIMAQTYPNIEIVVVDSGSRDCTNEIVKEFDVNFMERAAGMTRARNLGAQESRGELLMSLDSDMELTPKVIEECVAKVKDGHDAIIIPEVSVGEGFWAKCRALEKLCYIEDETIEATRFFKRSTLVSIEGYDEELEAGEDWDVTERVKKAGYNVGRVRAFIKHHEGRLTLWKTIGKKYQYGKTLEKYKRKHPKNAKQQLRVIRPSFVRNWRKLARDPVHALGMLFMKTCEFFAGGLGSLRSK